MTLMAPIASSPRIIGMMVIARLPVARKLRLPLVSSGANGRGASRLIRRATLGDGGRPARLKNLSWGSSLQFGKCREIFAKCREGQGANLAKSHQMPIAA